MPVSLLSSSVIAKLTVLSSRQNATTFFFSPESAAKDVAPMAWLEMLGQDDSINRHVGSASKPCARRVKGGKTANESEEQGAGYLRLQIAITIWPQESVHANGDGVQERRGPRQ